MKFLYILLAFFLTGCTTPIDNLDDYFKDSDLKRVHNRSVSTLVEYYFQDSTMTYLENIPCVISHTPGGSYVAGVNFWSSLASFLSGNGISRKCIMKEESLRSFGPEAIIHEYIHHLDDIGRDGIEEFINIEEFKTAWEMLKVDKRWFGFILYARPRADKWVTNVFGIGPESEKIAYVGGRLAAQQSGPDYLWNVFRKILRRH